jgi:hypothetical protein
VKDKVQRFDVGARAAQLNRYAGRFFDAIR